MTTMPLTSGRKNGHKKRPRRRKTRIKAGFISPRSPQSILAEARRKTSLKARNRSRLFATDSNTSPDRSQNHRDNRQRSKYSKYVMLSPSTEPLEENCLEREPLPEGYVFVPKGDVYVTRNCRVQTKESQRLVYAVYNNAGKRTTGLRVPSDVYAAVLQSAAATADSRANAVRVRDEKDLSRARQILRSKFPLMPADSLETVVDHAFLKGSGRVGRTAMKTDEKKATLAVEAHIRHVHTPYEQLLDAGKERREAREAVWDMVQAIKTAWEGGSPHASDPLALRGRIADSDSLPSTREVRQHDGDDDIDMELEIISISD
ncbi:DUF2293 domain-containing protein [Aspergillus clavatus NRRL 1]|uniref:DUF2293 domain-containing protein n=1 Tax=Aspergillus clavatus (strain ATCC 1007 / CBS 513.65 / DSM 816 / NCTC 3887 / NRRL 1 / QM 1276 / 107) TaxID=344612 RepID=A1CNF0_ASPCL|nr:uncharacterized protein ACLA_018750 [Aspergillus clavatus NRRL 1]EAW07171.1 conserved hypothetical protein [Aspergillus clavatus NRRL 1]